MSVACTCVCPPRRNFVGGVNVLGCPLVAWLRFSVIILLLLTPKFLPAQSASPRFNARILVDDILRYRLVSGQRVFGEAIITIVHDSTANLIHIAESTTGLFERSSKFTLKADSTLRPLLQHTMVSEHEFLQECRLEYHEHAVTGEVKRPEGFGGSFAINKRLNRDAADIYAVQHLVRASHLSVGRMLTFPIYNAFDNEESLARGWISKTETVTVPAGAFQCFRVEGFSGKARWILLLDTAYPHRIIKQIYPSAHLSLELVEVAATF